MAIHTDRADDDCNDDALISRRVYKAGMSHDDAVMRIREGRGTHFDPDVVDVFVDIHEQFRAIAKNFADPDSVVEEHVRRLETTVSEGPKTPMA